MMLFLRQYMLKGKNVIMSNRSWTLPVIEDPDDPENLLLEFSDEMLEAVGWKPGDTIIWEIHDDHITLKRKE